MRTGYAYRGRDRGTLNSNTLITHTHTHTQEGLPPLQTMDEMQCMWFQTELARAYYRLGKLGEALQKLHEIDNVIPPQSLVVYLITTLFSVLPFSILWILLMISLTSIHTV